MNKLITINEEEIMDEIYYKIKPDEKYRDHNISKKLFILLILMVAELFILNLISNNEYYFKISKKFRWLYISFNMIILLNLLKMLKKNI